MVSEDGRELSRSDYWDGRYSVSDGQEPTHEWFRSFAELEGFFQANLVGAQGLRPEDQPLVLHLGSGDSTIPTELASRGYTRQLCVDFSPVVVNLMSERHGVEKGIEWRQMDVRDMAGIADRSVDVAFDKGTLDAMIHGSPWSPPDEVKDNTGRYLKEVFRVLKDDGIFLYITFRQPHFIKPILNPDNLWNLDLQILGGGGSFDYYGYAIRKRREDDVAQNS